MIAHPDIIFRIVIMMGGILGYGCGTLLARGLSSAVFGVPTGIHWVILPGALALALFVALAGGAIPIGKGLKISPAAVLRNE